MKFLVVALAVVSVVVAFPPPDQLASSHHSASHADAVSGAAHGAAIYPVSAAHGGLLHGGSHAYGHNQALLIPLHGSGALHGGAALPLNHHIASAPALSSAYSAGYQQGVISSHIAAHGQAHQPGHQGVYVAAVPAHSVAYPAHHGKY